MKKIDINKFNKAMDQLVDTYADDKKVTDFERKVGASVCRATELAMSDLKLNSNQPKFRLVSAPTGGSKTSSCIALLSMLTNENKEFYGARRGSPDAQAIPPPRSISSMADISPLSISKENKSMFSLILSSLVLLGNTG